MAKKLMLVLATLTVALSAAATQLVMSDDPSSVLELHQVRVP